MRATAAGHEKPHHPHWPLALLLFAFALGVGLLTAMDPGAWIRVKTGARIVSELVLPRHDTFSYGAAGAPWSTHSWLADVVFHRLHAWGGPRLLELFRAAVAGAGFALLLPISQGNPVLAASILALGACAAWPGVGDSAAVFDLLFFALFLRLLRPRHRFRWLDAAGAAVLTGLWANLHGSSAVLALWFAGLKTFKVSLRAAANERLGYWVMMTACVIVFSWNPHGYRLLSMSFADAAPGAGAWELPFVSLYGVFLALGAAACWLNLQQEFVATLSCAAVLALSLALPGLRPLAALAACPMIALGLGHFVGPRPDTRQRVVRWAIFAGIVLGAYARGAAPRPAEPELAAAVRWLDAHGVRGRMFNEPETGAELIGLSERPVFADSRRALYPVAFLRDAEDWPRVFESLDSVYRFDYAVLRRRAEPPAALEGDAEWVRAYADERALIYLKRGGANAALAGPAPAPAPAAKPRRRR